MVAQTRYDGRVRESLLHHARDVVDRREDALKVRALLPVGRVIAAERERERERERGRESQ